ncbi:MmcQ/YjbR family DNA-binding protein [Roseibium litorale]|uniref:MmcQ/YjbR family DNA-binding protein n=1 Tax=Roseibium litorale TaxID=2803841 RepID=A0ABR9CLL6_9HYPH|nr:MmcQ/YjbR family DNA-binding protein [Roseibium litorale]MBD8891743.1 MmcQ/YjbR family DNA-binding protein [Roseibium litorale]
MTRGEFDIYCGALPKATHVIQWGNASVWKVGGKIFAICSGWGGANGDRISFKCSDLSYAMLIQEPGIIPAPYLARAKWVMIEQAGALTGDEIRAYIASAHKLIAATLTRKVRAELGLSV